MNHWTGPCIVKPLCHYSKRALLLDDISLKHSVPSAWHQSDTNATTHSKLVQATNPTWFGHMPSNSLSLNVGLMVANHSCNANPLHWFTCRKPEGLIHRDIKPSNVLLDHMWNAKLADVGLGKFLCNITVTDASASTVAGAFIYTDPECLATGQVYAYQSCISSCTVQN